MGRNGHWSRRAQARVTPAEAPAVAEPAASSSMDPVEEAATVTPELPPLPIVIEAWSGGSPLPIVIPDDEEDE